MNRAGDVRRRVHRWRREHRAPRHTVLRWVHHVSPRGPTTFGLGGRAIDQQRPGAVEVAPGAVIGDNVAFVLGPEGRVVIGPGAVVGHRTVIAADDLVRIGAGCRVGLGATITDTWTYGRSATGFPPPEPVELGDGATVGPNAVLGPGALVPAGHTVPAGGRVDGTSGAG